MTVNCAPDNPVVDTSAGSTSYTENAAATVIDAAVTVTDPDAGTTITGATVQISGNFASGQDVLALAGSHPGIGASFVGDTLTLTGSASPAAYQAALRDVTYSNSSENPSTLPRTITFTVTDDTARSGSDTKGLTVSAVDDPPVAVNDSATVLEDAAATAITVLSNDTDVDAGPKTISSASDPANGTVVLTGGPPATGLTYQPDANYCNNPPGTAPDTFTYTLNGGSTATVSVTVTCVNDAPVADDETFNAASSAVGNTTLNVNDPSDGRPATPDPTDTAPVTDRPHKEITGDILAGDADVDSPAGGLTVTAGTFATNDGGTVTIEADGDFNFEPAATTSCTDTSDFFDYTLNDNDPLGNQTDTGRVTIAISGCVWYVNNDDAQGNSGTSEKPFDTLAQAEGASGTGHSIFVYDGNNTTTGYAAGISLKANQKLIGEAAALIVGSDTLHSADAANKPTITDNNADVVELDDGNEVRGFNIDPQGTGGGIAGASGDTGGGTIDDVNIVDTGTAGNQPGLELDTTTGTFNISNLIVNNGDNNAATSTDIGVRLNNAGTVNFTPAGTISIATAGAAGLSATGTNMGTSTFDAITVTASGSGGVNMSGTTGTTTFAALSLTTTSGAPAAFGLSNAGTVSVQAAGTANVSATGGPAVDVTGTSGATLDFDAVSSTNSANDGINLAGLGTGTFSATAGTIAGAAGIAFDLDGGSGTVTYPGALNDGAGATADITSRGGGAVTLSGAIADTNDTGGGITVTGNTAGSTTFSNASKVINTGTANAIVMGTSPGHTLTLSGGGLDVDTTSGAGIDATGGGTVSLTGSANTVATSTGRPVNISGTAIGAAGFTLASVTASGAAPNGIVLSNTSGPFTVTGSTSIGQAAGAGPTGVGISLTNLSSGPISFGAVDIQRRGSTGILLDNVDTTASFGSTTIPNQSNVGGYGIRVQDSSGQKTFASATISDANVVTAQNDAGSDGIPDTDGDGDAIFLKNNTGGFTLNGGSLSNCGNDCIDLRDSAALVLSGVSISAPGQDVTGATGAGFGGHGISAINLTGTSTITGGSVSGFNVGNRDGLYLTNTTSTPLALTIQGTTFQNSTGNRGVGILAAGTSDMTVTVGGPTNNAATNVTFSNISATALQGSAADTAKLDLTVQRSTFQNTPLNGKTNLLGSGIEATNVNYKFLNNTFTNVMNTASTGEGLISLSADGTDAGNQFRATIQGNVISNVGTSLSNCAGGATPCLGPLTAILVFIDDAANVPATLVVDSNNLTNVQQGGIFVDMANTGAASSAVSARITSNVVGTAASPVGARLTGATNQSGIRLERRRNNSLAGNALISGNSVRNGSGGSGSTLNAPGIFARTKANSNLSVTVTGNNVDTNLTGGVAEMRFDTNANEVGDIVAPTQCDDITGNTLPAGAAAVIDLNEINGTHNVEQASSAAVAAANSAASVTADAGISFGITCATPP